MQKPHRVLHTCLGSREIPSSFPIGATYLRGTHEKSYPIRTRKWNKKHLRSNMATNPTPKWLVVPIRFANTLVPQATFRRCGLMPPVIEAALPARLTGRGGDGRRRNGPVGSDPEAWERIEKLGVLYGAASESKKGEDFTFVKTECQRAPGHGDTTFSVSAVINLLTHKVHILDGLFCICRI
ncbi:hypothetical protein BHE74_00035345 [Ensete ventricosum]|nr:hypothetical protein GW17_00009116 [Ensete ventricosum]RWW57835.1 hypothetical protein BHE74_00035345 [Ensete ventricosum]